MSLDPDLLWDIEEFSVLEGECVMLTRVSSSRIADHAGDDSKPDLLPWACAIGEGVRFSLGHSPREAWSGALSRHRDRLG
jgi:hypothetical protein